MNKTIRRALVLLLVAVLTAQLAACNANDTSKGAPMMESTPMETGENAENTNPGNQNAEETDLSYWNGFDFGPNLEYAEEYQSQSDSGDYMSAFEAAKLTFDTVRDNGSIPEYSDDMEYTMTLVALESIDGEECYVYRLDADEASGTIGAAYAYAYQSGNIYMQGYGGQYVLTGGGQ